jgi:hypothetical protein
VTPGDAPGDSPAGPFVLRDQQQASFMVVVPNPARFSPETCAPQRVSRIYVDAAYDGGPVTWRTTICTGSQGRPYLTHLRTPSDKHH